MAKASRSVVRWVAGLGLAAVVAWQAADYFFARRTGPDKLANRFWLERVPTNPRDMVWHLFALEDGGRRLGALGRASRWRVFSDGFHWKAEGDRFSFHTPQNDCRTDAKARTWKCAGEAPKPFELCLELEAGGKTFRYYSREDWVIRPRENTPAELAFLDPALQAARALPEHAGPEATLSGDDPACAALGPLAP